MAAFGIVAPDQTLLGQTIAETAFDAAFVFFSASLARISASPPGLSGTLTASTSVSFTV